MAVNSTERQVNLVSTLLKARVPLSWDDIACIEGYDDKAALRTRRKRFERDLHSLREVGLDVIRSGDTFHASYEIDRGACLLPTLDLSRDQRLLLYRVGIAYLEGGGAGPLGEHLANAIMKLQAGAGSGLPARLPQGFIKRTLLRRPGETERFKAVGDALLTRRRVKFKYSARAANRAAPRVVEPWALVSRRGGWYLVGRDTDRNDVRTFRLSRIQGQVTTTRQSAGPQYEIPDGFDSETAFSTEAFGRGEGAYKDVRIVFDADVAFVVENEFEGACPITRKRDGSVVLHLPQAYPDELLRYLGEFPGHWQVQAPAPLRALIADRLKDALKRHGGRP